MKKYLSSLAFYVLISIIACITSVAVCEFINFGLLVTLIIRLIICLIIPNVIFLIVYVRKSEFKQSVQLVNKMLHGKLNFIVKKVNM